MVIEAFNSMPLDIIISVRTISELDAFRRVNLVKIKRVLALNAFKYIQEYGPQCLIQFVPVTNVYTESSTDFWDIW